MTGEQIGRHRSGLDRLRSFGISLFEEVAPSVDRPRQPTSDIDGVLVMFIPPGTKQTADLTQLDKVARLSPKLPIAVDGGITRQIAQQCHDRGAGYLISGRDMFTTTRNNSPTTRERRSA